MNTMVFQAARAPWNAAIEVHMAVRSGEVLSVAQPVVMQAADQGRIYEPFMRLELTAAQQLMDELWHCGLRPTEGTGSAGSLAATERHLQDMRKLVFEQKHGDAK